MDNIDSIRTINQLMWDRGDYYIAGRMDVLLDYVIADDESIDINSYLSFIDFWQSLKDIPTPGICIGNSGNISVHWVADEERRVPDTRNHIHLIFRDHGGVHLLVKMNGNRFNIVYEAHERYELIECFINLIYEGGYESWSRVDKEY